MLENAGGRLTRSETCPHCYPVSMRESDVSRPLLKKSCRLSRPHRFFSSPPRLIRCEYARAVCLYVCMTAAVGTPVRGRRSRPCRRPLRNRHSRSPTSPLPAMAYEHGEEEQRTEQGTRNKESPVISYVRIFLHPPRSSCSCSPFRCLSLKCRVPVLHLIRGEVTETIICQPCLLRSCLLNFSRLAKKHHLST